MLRKEVTIFFADDTIDVYVNSKEAEYHTQVGVAGELILYRVTLHLMLSAMMKPEVWKLLVAG